MSAALLFLKYPTPGRVKTRLAATIGAEAAAAAYREMVAHVCRQLPSDAEIWVFFDPPEERERVREWLEPLLERPFSMRPQARGDLGMRLAAAFEEVLAEGNTPAMVVGTDCVEITPATFAAAEAALERVDVALGPTHDGGYYLMGLNAPQPALFRDIAWSTGRTLTQTLDRAAGAGLVVHCLEKFHDVDDETDWRRAQVLLADGQ